MSKTLSFYNLTGGLNTAQDLATINSTPNRTESPEMINVEYYKLGGIQTMKGNKEIGSSSDFEAVGYKDILCGIEYTIGNNSYMLVADKEGYIYEYDKDDNEFNYVNIKFSTVTTKNEQDEDVVDEDFYANERIYAVPYNNGIVFVNGYEALYYNHDKPTLNKVWVPKLEIEDDSTTPSTTLTTTFHPVCVASYRGRLFFGANKCTQVDENEQEVTYEGGMLFYSGVGLGIEETWQESSNLGEDAGAFKEFFEDSSNFTGLGTWAEYLVIHKEQNTYTLDGTMDLASEWELKPYSEYTVPSQQSYVIANNGYYSYIPEAGGIHPLFTRSIYNTLYQGTDISIKIKDSFDLLDNLAYDKTYAVYHPKKKYMMFYMTTLDGNGSNNCFIYDINTKSWLHRKVPQYVTCAFRFDNEIYIGIKDSETNTVKVLKEFSGKTFDGKSIEFSYLTPPFIWGGGTNKTTSKEFRVKLVNSGANHFYIESFKDGLTESKEQRLVKNVNDNLNGLLWDIGLAQADKLWDDAYVADTFYSFTVGDNTYYADKENPTDDTRIYSSIEAVDVNGTTRYVLKNFINFYKYFRVTTLIPSDSSDYDTTKDVYYPSYAYNDQVKGSFCYRNGKYYAWVDQVTGLCTTNLKYTDWYEWYGIKLTGGEGSPQRFRVSKTLLDDINAKLNRTATIWKTIDYTNDMRYWRYDNSTWAKGSWVTGNNHTWYSALYTMQQYGKYVDDGLNMSMYLDGGLIQRYQGNTWKGKSQIPESEWKNNPDTVKGNPKNNEIPTGTKPLSITKGTKATGEQASITISVKEGGKTKSITLTRYSAGDLGKRTGDTNYYTKTTANGSTTVYKDGACTETYNTGTISGDNLTVGANVYTRYPQTDSKWKDIEYYLYTNLTNGNAFDGAIEIYPYPDDDDLIWRQTLTDTTWDFTPEDVKTQYFIIDRPGAGARTGERLGYTYEDIELKTDASGDAWLHPGYQTKRMLLPNQYFETVQFKFSGGGYDKDGNERYNDNICISGFEVDGIQLAETPWK